MHLEDMLASSEFQALILTDAMNVKQRQEYDSIPVIDEILAEVRGCQIVCAAKTSQYNHTTLPSFLYRFVLCGFQFTDFHVRVYIRRSSFSAYTGR